MQLLLEFLGFCSKLKFLNSLSEQNWGAFNIVTSSASLMLCPWMQFLGLGTNISVFCSFLWMLLSRLWDADLQYSLFLLKMLYAELCSLPNSAPYPYWIEDVFLNQTLGSGWHDHLPTSHFFTPYCALLFVLHWQEAEIAASLDSLATLKPEVAERRGALLLNLKCSDVQVCITSHCIEISYQFILAEPLCKYLLGISQRGSAKIKVLRVKGF
jgi:hypothetical protein